MLLLPRTWPHPDTRGRGERDPPPQPLCRFDEWLRAPAGRGSHSLSRHPTPSSAGATVLSCTNKSDARAHQSCSSPVAARCAMRLSTACCGPYHRWCPVDPSGDGAQSMSITPSTSTTPDSRETAKSRRKTPCADCSLDMVLPHVKHCPCWPLITWTGDEQLGHLRTAWRAHRSSPTAEAAGVEEGCGARPLQQVVREPPVENGRHDDRKQEDQQEEAREQAARGGAHAGRSAARTAGRPAARTAGRPAARASVGGAEAHERIVRAENRVGGLVLAAKAAGAGRVRRAGQSIHLKTQPRVPEKRRKAKTAGPTRLLGSKPGPPRGSWGAPYCISITLALGR